MSKKKQFKTNAHFGVGCLFTIEKYKADGTITQTLGPFHNTVLDTGLDGLADYNLGAMTARCHVGTGNTAPTTSDTSLDSHLATTTSLYGSASYGGSAVTSSLPYAYAIRTFSFSIGTVTGNLAEVGLSRDNGPTYTYFNRQLFLDETDSPTTITVLADEGLRVTAEVRVYGDLTYGDGTGTGSFTFDNDGSSEANGWTRYCSGSGWGSYLAGYPTYYGTLAKPKAAISTSTTNTFQNYTTSSSKSHDTYTGGTYTRSTDFTWSAGSLNGTYERIFLGCENTNSATTMQPFHVLVFDSSITVASTEAVEFTISISWGRYTA